MQNWRTTTDRSLALFSMLIILVAQLFMVAPRSYAAGEFLKNRYDRISNSTVSSVANHVIGFTVNDLATPIGSIFIQFCSNSPIIGDACTAPAGFDVSAVALQSQAGETGFSIAPGVTQNTLVLTRPAALPSGAASQYVLTNIVNPNATGSYYGRIQTYTSTDATGPAIEQGGVVFAITQGLSISIEVPPYLIFCAAVTISGFDCGTATSYFIDMGEFSTTKTTAASSEFQVATNAPSGYSITASGTTLTSGNNTISAIYPAGASTTGASQFGFNLRKNTAPLMGDDPTGYMAGTIATEYATPNLFQFHNGDTLVSSTTTTDYEKFTVSYVTNISSSQPMGYYATTITYICLANF